MKITANQLKRIIKEEVSKVLREDFTDGSMSPESEALADAVSMSGNLVGDDIDEGLFLSVADLRALPEYSEKAYQECLAAGVFEPAVRCNHDSGGH